MRRAYGNPPIVEAVVEFRFTKESEWDWTIPGKFHQREPINRIYDGRPKETTSITMTANSPTPNAVKRLRLANRSEDRTILLEHNMLGVVTLRPYDGWEAFQRRVHEAWTEYLEVAQPEGLERVGVRYINQIEVPREAIDLSDYFAWDHPVPKSIGDATIEGFHSRVVLARNDGTRVLVTHSSMPGESGNSAFLLDLDVSSQGTVELDSALKVVERLHDVEGQAFEDLIRDPARELFE